MFKLLCVTDRPKKRSELGFQILRVFLAAMNVEPIFAFRVDWTFRRWDAAGDWARVL